MKYKNFYRLSMLLPFDEEETTLGHIFTDEVTIKGIRDRLGDDYIIGSAPSESYCEHFCNLLVKDLEELRSQFICDSAECLIDYDKKQAKLLKAYAYGVEKSINVIKRDIVKYGKILF